MMIKLNLNRAQKDIMGIAHWLFDRGFMIGQDVRYDFEGMWIVLHLPEELMTEFKLRFG